MSGPADVDVTVAVPTCNGSRHLRTTLESILRSETPHHLLVVDDRSADATLAIVREVAGDRARIEVNPERLGLAGNWNRCLALSRTPVVSIFHQDDVMLPGHLETHVAAHRRTPALGWVASAADVIDDEGRAVARSTVEPGGLGDRDIALDDGRGVEMLMVTNPLRCSAVTINRSAHAEVGGFDPSYRYVVDWDFWIRVANARPVAWKARTTAAVRWHPRSETHRFATGTDDLEETARLLDWIDRHLDIYTESYPEWRVAADRRLGRAFLNRAHVAFKAGDPTLARRSLARSLRLAPSAMLRALLADGRLGAQMGLALLAPGLVRRRRPAGPERAEPGRRGR